MVTIRIPGAPSCFEVRRTADIGSVAGVVYRYLPDGIPHRF
jgi:hypothetical protein